LRHSRGTAIAISQSPIDLRISQRYPTHIEGTATVQGMLHPIVIADISAEGALVRGLPALMPGARIVLRARALDVAANVVRVSDRGLGVRFHTVVNPLAVVRQNYAGLEHLRKPATLGDEPAQARPVGPAIPTPQR
jgi:hypothetical protein